MKSSGFGCNPYRDTMRARYFQNDKRQENSMIYSMTAYARKEVKGDWGTAVWEIRSVNQRYLEPPPVASSSRIKSYFDARE